MKYSYYNPIHTKPFLPSVVFHMETCKANDWFLYEMQQWAEVG